MGLGQILFTPTRPLSRPPSPNQMDEAQLITLDQLKAQPTACFAYSLQNDPKPGTKVMHAYATDHVIYGIASLAISLMADGVTTKDVSALVMVEYNHFPNRQFEVHAPRLLYETARQVINTSINQLCNQSIKN